MARVGISKSYTAGALTDVTALFAIIKQFVIDAGFYVVTNTSTRIEFMPAGTTPAANTDDDTPHWMIYQTGTDQIHAVALHGMAWDDAAIRTGQPSLIIDTPIQWWDGSMWEAAACWIHAAADGREGWFWIGTRQDLNDDELIEIYPGYHAVVCGTRAARLAADMTAGLAARYGLVDNAGVFSPPYCKNRLGAVISPSLGWWSPLASNGNGMKRHTGSPLGQMSAPVWPEMANSQFSTAMFGQLQDVLVCTDGFAHLGTTIPGWVTYNSHFYSDCPFALRAPPAFTSV